MNLEQLRELFSQHHSVVAGLATDFTAATKRVATLENEVDSLNDKLAGLTIGGSGGGGDRVGKAALGAFGSFVSDISACETDLAAQGTEDFWLIVTIKEWR